jgi:hypothetical protein
MIYNARHVCIFYHIDCAQTDIAAVPYCAEEDAPPQAEGIAE